MPAGAASSNHGWQELQPLPWELQPASMGAAAETRAATMDGGELQSASGGAAYDSMAISSGRGWPASTGGARVTGKHGRHGVADESGASAGGAGVAGEHGREHGWRESCRRAWARAQAARAGRRGQAARVGR
ncbi:one cut domain family member 3-like [Triticum dicoccoides]|uniref:one cut domain family member 3-like n=1 Tax=Triticum dicoccoides TaxID=85692 RepID=UPI00188FAA53|nr:one cut domain family member 3-like [Triticum dicoccoides]